MADVSFSAVSIRGNGVPLLKDYQPRRSRVRDVLKLKTGALRAGL